MAQERQGAVADQVDRGLMAGDEQEDARGEQLVLAQRVARFLGGDEAREHVVPRRGPALGDEPAEVLGEGAAAGEALLGHLRVRRQQDGVETARDVHPPRLEALVVLDGDAEHLADDGHGQRIRELLDQVHRPRALDSREQAVDDLLDVRPESLDHARGERLADEAPQPRVVRGVAIQHRQPDAGRDGHAEARRHERGDRLLGETRVAQYRHDVLVPGEHPEPEGTVVDGILGAQAMVGGIGISDELRIHRIEGQGAHRVTLDRLIHER